jgi:hypothetical protein
MMPGVSVPPAPEPASATQVMGAAQVTGAAPAKPRRSVYLESPEAMRASAAGETAGIPRPPMRGDRKRIQLFAAIAVIVVLIAGIGTYAIASLGGDTPDSVWVSSEKGGGPQIEFQAFEHPLGFRTKVPKTWKPQWADKAHTRIKFYDASGAMYLQLYAQRTSATQQEIWSGGEGYQKKKLQDYKRLAFKPAKVGGKDALDWEFTYYNAQEKVTRHILDRGIVINGTSYQLYFTAPEDKFETNAPLLDAVAKSFELTS